MPRGNATNGLLNTVILLLLYQFLRWLSFKEHNREFVVPAKMSDKGLWENTKTSAFDYIILMIYMASVCGLTILATHY